MIYLDHAATTNRKPQCVIDAVTFAMNHMGNSGRAAHGNSLDASRVIYEAREKVAKLFGLKKAKNVIFTSNATEALNIAIFGSFSKGDHIISTDLEHNSALRPLYELNQNGIEVDFLKADQKGVLQYDDLNNLIKTNTKAIICTHASNLTGNIVDIERISKFAKQHNLLFILDASQTAGRFHINMEQSNIDILCFTGHKSLLGPQGTGGLCIRDGIEIRPLKMGGTGVQTYLTHQPKEYPTRLEAGTLNGHGIAGLSAALTYIEEIGIDTLRNKEIELTKYFYKEVTNIEGITVYGDFSHEHAPIVTLNWKDMPSTELADYLWDEFEIATRAGAHCAPRMHEALGTVEQGAVRFSFGYENTFEELQTVIEALKELQQ